MTVGDLFAGIGGFRLGLEAAGGFDFKWACEIDPYCRAVYAKHWPETLIYGDIRELTNPPYVDMLCGGFPCQDLSVAGKRAGIAGERSGLWSEFARLICEVGPRYVFVENVPGLLVHGGIARVLGNLASCGYDAEWDCIPAGVFGAHFRRDRIFVIAQRPMSGCGGLQGCRPRASGAWSKQQLEGLVRDQLQLAVPSGRAGRISVRVPNRVHRLRALGNAVVPQVVEWIGRRIPR